MKKMAKLLSLTFLLTLGLIFYSPTGFAAEWIAGDPDSVESQEVFSDASNNELGNGALDGTSVEGPAREAAVPIDGKWQEFSWNGAPGQARGCLPADPGGISCESSYSGNSEFAGPPPWTFTASVS